MTTLQAVSNFLVPATGSTNAYQLKETFSSTPVYVDFSQVGLNGIPFRPSGVLVDNSAGTSDLTVLINEMSFKMVCPKGGAIQMPFPAPIGCTASITGAGVATVVFVDYPVIPYVFTSTSGGIPNPLPVTGPLTDDELRASAVPVSVADGEDAAQGTTTDAAVTDPADAGTVIALLKGLLTKAFPTGNTYAAAITSSSAAGTVAAGTFSVSFNNTGAAGATVAGGSLPAGSIVSFEAPIGSTLDAITYDGTGTTLLISALTVD